MNGTSLKRKILKAKVMMKRRKERWEEEKVKGAEKKAFRAEKETERKVKLTERKVAAAAKTREAEATLRAQREAEKKELLLGREVRKARLLSERELRAAQLKPYIEAAKEVGKVGVGIGRTAMRSLERLGEMGKESPKRPRREAPLNLGIDLGFPEPRHERPSTPRHERPRKPSPRVRPRGLLEGDDPLGLKPKHKEPPLSLNINIK